MYTVEGWPVVNSLIRALSEQSLLKRSTWEMSLKTSIELWRGCVTLSISWNQHGAEKRGGWGSALLHRKSLVRSRRHAKQSAHKFERISSSRTGTEEWISRTSEQCSTLMSAMQTRHTRFKFERQFILSNTSHEVIPFVCKWFVWGFLLLRSCALDSPL